MLYLNTTHCKIVTKKSQQIFSYVEIIPKFGYFCQVFFSATCEKRVYWRLSMVETL